MPDSASRLQKAAQDVVDKFIAGRRLEGVPEDAIAAALDLVGCTFRAAYCELRGVPVEVDKSTERYQMLHILVSDALNVRMHPNTVPTAADRMVADIYDVLEETK